MVFLVLRNQYLRTSALRAGDRAQCLKAHPAPGSGDARLSPQHWGSRKISVSSHLQSEFQASEGCDTKVYPAPLEDERWLPGTHAGEFTATCNSRSMDTAFTSSPTHKHTYTVAGQAKVKTNVFRY